VHACDRNFERSASELLGKLYEADQDQSRMLLKRPLETWNGSSVFELATNAGLMDFMNSACCQDALSKMWNRRIPTELAGWKVGPNTVQFSL